MKKPFIIFMCLVMPGFVGLGSFLFLRILPLYMILAFVATIVILIRFNLNLIRFNKCQPCSALFLFVGFLISPVFIFLMEYYYSQLHPPRPYNLDFTYFPTLIFVATYALPFTVVAFIIFVSEKINNRTK